MRTKISFHKQMRINTSKVCLVICSFGGLRTPVDLDIFFLVSSTKVYYFSRKSLSKYLMDTIDFNKHDIDIFINLVKIVRYGKHCRVESCKWRLLFWRQLSQCEIVPIWRLQKYVHFKYILWHFEYVTFWVDVITIKKLLSLIEFFVQVNQARWDQRLCNQNKNSIIRQLACNM